MSPAYLLTVDLGTSHAVAVLRWPDGRSRPLLFDGQPVLPVGVYCDEAGDLHVGRDAVRLSAVAPARYEPYPKRVAAQETVLLGDREVGTAAMFAAALRRVALACAETTGALPRTILTCPPSWSGRRREVLADAAAQAGFGAVEFVTEPVAAAHYYREVLGRPLAADRSLAVIDFGAGTVDIAVLTDTGGRLAVAAEGGVHDFGGIDLDAAVVDHLREVLGASHPDAWAAIDAPRTEAQRRARHQLWTEVREAKEMLSRFTVAPIGVPGIEAGIHLTRAELDAIARPLLEPVIEELARVREAVEDRPVEAVFLVGGASRMPLVSSLVHEALGTAPVVIEQPELAVAEGASAAPQEETPPTPAFDYSPVPAETPIERPAEPTPPAPGLPAPAPRKRRYAFGAVAVVIALVAALIAYIALQGEPGDGEEPFAAHRTADAATACPGTFSTLDGGAASLIGPHFTLAPTCAGLLTAAEAAEFEALGETPNLEDAERLAVVHFAAAGLALTLSEGGAHRVATTVRLGDESWELDGLPEADSLFAAVVDADAPLSVAVADAERTQTLDLATGEIDGRLSAYYHGELASREFTIVAQMALATPDGDRNIESASIDDPVTVTRAAFDEEAGWLCDAEGALVTATFSLMIEATEHGLEWPFEPASALRIVTGDSTIAAKSVTFEDKEEDRGGEDSTGVYRYFTVVYEVPGDATALQFEIDLPDAMYETDRDKWYYATDGGGTQRYSVDFAA